MNTCWANTMNQLELTQTTEQWWMAFANQALPNVRQGSTQYLEMRKAFYVGLHQMLRVVTGAADVDLDEDTFSALLSRRESEIEIFFSASGGLYEKAR